jgi:4-hydroxy-4-methyl-2-oxoglutarate aldolase
VIANTADRAAALDVSQKLRDVGTDVISGALKRLGSTNFVLGGLAPVTDIRSTDGHHVAGPAFTIQRAPANLAHAARASHRQELHRTVGKAAAGDVVVVSASGTGEAIWGDRVTALCKEQGIAAAIIDGAIRDSRGVRSVGLAVFARGVNFYSSGQVILSSGEPVCIGGAIVRPGDVVVGDEDGVLVVAAELLPVILSEVENDQPGRR